MKSLPKSFATNKSIVEKYNLSNNFETFSKIKPPKRGGARESFSDAENLFVRAALDKIFGTTGPLRESWRVGALIFDGCCYICDEKIYTETGEIVSNAVIHADHIIPPNKGGTISAGNLLAAHGRCNILKGSTPFEEFFKNHPEKLEKIMNFQSFYNYSAPDPEVFQTERKRITEIWESMMDEI